MSFQFIDLILVIGISQGIFLATSLHLLQNKNKEANRSLSLVLLMAVLMLFGRIAGHRMDVEWLWRIAIFADTTILLFGPLIYLYVRRLTFMERPKYRLSIVHYIPAMVHVSFCLWVVSHDQMGFETLVQNPAIRISFFIVEAAGLLSFTYYMVRSFLSNKAYRNAEKQQLSHIQGIGTFLWVFLGALAVLNLLWWYSFLNGYFLKLPTPFINYELIWISTPVFIYVVGYFSLRQPEIFRITPIAKKPVEKSRLTVIEIQQLQKRLDFFMEEEKVFLQQDITLKNLSEKINTSPNNLSWLLNQVYELSFYDFINSRRVKEYILRIEKGEHQRITLLGLAYEVGFNSKTTFNKVFKQQMGVTPSAFVKQQNVA